MTGEPTAATPTRTELAAGFAALTILALLAWWQTVSHARAMGNLPGTMGMPILPFISMWVVMMVAMMLPATTPIVTLWGRMIARQSPGITRVVRMGIFLSAYVLAWALLGVLAWFGLRGLESALPDKVFTNGVVGAVALGVAGIYQLTPAKNVCLEHCRSPIALLAHFRGHHERLADLRIGFLHGGYCVGCCAGLMVVLMGVGLMNLPAMVLLTALIFAEKLAPRGELIARITGVAFLLAAPLVLMYPATLMST